MSYLRSNISAALFVCCTAFQITVAHAGTDVGITSVSFPNFAVARPNDLIDVRVDVKNLGTTVANDVWVTATLPANVDYEGAGGTGIEVKGGSGNLICAHATSLNPDESLTFVVLLYPSTAGT